MFTKNDAGCYIGNNRGVYVYEGAQGLAKSHGWTGDIVTYEDSGDLCDLSDATDEATEYLNSLCSDDCYFAWNDGDLMLVENGSEMDQYIKGE